MEKERSDEGLLIDELKKLKKGFLKAEPETAIAINLPFRRRYPVELKKKLIHSAKKIGAYQASAQSSVPESTIRRWKREGPEGNHASSGRNFVLF